ncbi:MAG: HAMP domain-containing histidine kinase, partial [Pseudomonadales bacterium]|nr:HAMP domain-containing histidine kinase [Pseudomonadales bacterium]
DPQDLTPLSETNTPSELTELVESSNGLLYRLRQSFDREKRFSGDAAHELRTPISALKIHLYNLRDIVPPNNESFQMLNVSIERMSHLIEQMLVLHRTTPDQFAKNFQKFDLHQAAQQQIIDQYQSFSDKQQTIELVGDVCGITADVFAIKTLLKNILDNACKYTPVGGAVKLSVAKENSNAVVMVDDSGEGISEELYSRVFERFYRVDGDQHKSNVIGCGLGFSIIQHIVDLHKGDISLSRSCFDTGLKITVVLPVEQGKCDDA